MIASSVTVFIPGAAVAKGRARITRTGRAFTPAKTRNAEAYARHCMQAQAGQPMLEGALSLDVIVCVAIPASWSKRKREDAQAGIVRPTARPDLDNYAKLICDAANGLLWRDDAQIVEMRLAKSYSAKPGTTLLVRAVDAPGAGRAIPLRPGAMETPPGVPA